MLTKEDLQAIAELMDGKLQPVNERLDKIENDIAEIKEDTEITREVTNEIVEWIDAYWRDNGRPFPVEKEAI